MIVQCSADEDETPVLPVGRPRPKLSLFASFCHAVAFTHRGSRCGYKGGKGGGVCVHHQSASEGLGQVAARGSRARPKIRNSDPIEKLVFFYVEFPDIVIPCNLGLFPPRPLLPPLCLGSGALVGQRPGARAFTEVSNPLLRGLFAGRKGPKRCPYLARWHR